MKKFSLTFLFGLFFLMTVAQTVKVEEETESVKGAKAVGYQVALAAARQEVAGSWTRFLREAGKPKSIGNFWQISEPTLIGTSYANNIYATVKSAGDGSAVWIGLVEADWPEGERAQVMKDLENIVYWFGVKFHRDQIQVQIDEAQTAVDAVQKQQQRLLNQNKDLTQKLNNNELEKIKLERALEANKLEHEVLLLKLDKNKKSADSIAVSSGQIQKVLELHQERQRKVN